MKFSKFFNLRRLAVLNAAVATFILVFLVVLARNQASIWLYVINGFNFVINIWFCIMNLKRRRKYISNGLLCPHCDENTGRIIYAKFNNDYTKGLDLINATTDGENVQITFKCFTCNTKWTVTEKSVTNKKD
jgi:hypothetical protein